MKWWPFRKSQRLPTEPPPSTEQRPYDRLEARRTQLGLNSPISLPQPSPNSPTSAPRDSVPGLKTQWGRQISYWIESLPGEPFLDDLALVLNEFGFFKVTLILLGLAGAVTFWLDLAERQETQFYTAWGLLTGDAPAGTNSGRTRALEDLHQAGFSLRSINLEQSYLPGLDLGRRGSLGLGSKCWHFLPMGCRSGADLNRANFAGAALEFVNLTGASLGAANLQGANLRGSKLQSGDLRRADLTQANLSYAELQQAYLWRANLEGAELFSANLSQVSLEEANLGFTDLAVTYTENTDFKGSILLKTTGTDALSFEQLDSAYLCRTELPREVQLDPNRDCAVLPEILADRADWFDTLEEAQKYLDRALQE
ncbi:MAG: pentapeptide repeat-containing protein [Prochlorothrix sp.]